MPTGALVKPCTAALAPSNTGVECNVSMGPTALIFLMPKNVKWQASDEEDFLGYVNTQISAPVASRWYPIFGQAAPIRTITNGKENDVIQTFDDGSMALIRKGMYTRTYLTNDGGYCLAQSLLTFDPLGYSFVEVDVNNNVLRMQNADGSFSGVPTNLSYAPNPELGDFKTSYMNAFMLNFNPINYIKKGAIATCTADLSSLEGLLDVAVSDAGGSSITKLNIAVATICAETDLVAEYGDTLAAISNFIVTLTSTGVVQTLTAAAVVGDYIALTGTFVAGSEYTVSAAPAATWAAANIIGFEGTIAATITIPG